LRSYIIETHLQFDRAGGYHCQMPWSRVVICILAGGLRNLWQAT
jgi:hypothetical protein